MISFWNIHQLSILIFKLAVTISCVILTETENLKLIIKILLSDIILGTSPVKIITTKILVLICPAKIAAHMSYSQQLIYFPVFATMLQ